MLRLLFALVVITFIAAALIVAIQSPAFEQSTETGSEDAVNAAPLDVRRVGTAPARTPSTREVSTARLVSVPDAPSPPTQVETGRRRVLADQTAVYSRNSEHGEVLTLLQEGDEVELGVSVLHEDGLWVEVRLNAQSAGFVRSETLSLN